MGLRFILTPLTCRHNFSDKELLSSLKHKESVVFRAADDTIITLITAAEFLLLFREEIQECKLFGFSDFQQSAARGIFITCFD